MKIELTENAVNEVKRIKSEQESPEAFLRIAIVGAGCSGFSHKLELDPNPGNTEKDLVIEYSGVKILVDKRSALYLDGTTIDFINDLNKMGFVLNNPSFKNKCGCGSSFSM